MLVEGVTRVRRHTFCLLLGLIITAGIISNQSQVEAMKASPHPFVVEQDDEEIILKMKGDEYQHWITDEDGK